MGARATRWRSARAPCGAPSARAPSPPAAGRRDQGPLDDPWVMRSGAMALALMLAVATGALAESDPAAAFAVVPVKSGILFGGDATVPPPVQEFAWRVLERRCHYQGYEREQRSFWAYRTQSTSVDGGVVYSIGILSYLAWKKTEPPAIIEMAIRDDGHLQLMALKSSFVVC